MTRRWPAAGLVLALTLVPLAHAGPRAMAETEINYLLDFVGSSGCEFYRNGGWYDSKRAQAHLRSRYQWLAARDQINTAEDFIEKAATTSSLSGRPYEVKCDGSEAVPSNRWLREELTRYRSTDSHEPEGAPRSMRGTPEKGSMHLARAGSSVVLLDLKSVMDVLDAVRVTRDGHSLVYCFLGSGGAG